MTQPGYGQSDPQQPQQAPSGGYGYGQPQQPQYGAQPYGSQPYATPGYGAPGYAAEHPQAQTVFILGIIGIFTTIPAFIAWYLGAQAKKEIDAGAPYAWDGKLKTGYLLGKIFSIIFIVVLALSFLAIFAGIALGISQS